MTEKIEDFKYLQLPQRKKKKKNTKTLMFALMKQTCNVFES